MSSMLGIKNIAKLQQKKYRTEFGAFVVEGQAGVWEALEAGVKPQQLLVTEHFLSHYREFCERPLVQAELQKNSALRVSEETFNRLVDSTTPQGIAAVIALPITRLSSLLSGSLVAILEDIRDPGNLGTMIRTADWFGVDGILLLGGADPYQPKVVRSSMGSLFHLPIVVADQASAALAELTAAGFQLVVTRPELAEKSNPPLPTDQKLAVIFGNEAHGTSSQLDNLADFQISIPKFGQAESLNVAVSFGIIMHQLRTLLSRGR